MYVFNHEVTIIIGIDYKYIPNCFSYYILITDYRLLAITFFFHWGPLVSGNRGLR